MDRKILVYGSSISWGAWDEVGGWVDRLKQYINKKVIDSEGKYYCLLYNLGISGDDTTGVIKRLEDELTRRFDKSEELVVIFEMGINDSMYKNAEKEFRTPKEKFKENLRELIKLSRRHTDKIVFVGLSPAVDSILDPIPWHPAASYKTEYIKEFDEMIKDICKENNLLFIDTLTPFAERDYQKLLTLDGIHPNSEGHKFIFEIVKNELEKNNLI